MSTATMWIDDDNRVTRIAIAPNEAPNDRDGFVGWIAEGWDGDPVTGHPVWWFKLSDSQWGPKIAPTAGPAGPPGSMGPHVPGAAYTALANTVIVNRTIWQCQQTHTAAADGDGTRTAFERDAVAGFWAPVNASPVETFDPYLAGSAQPVAQDASPTHVFTRQTGTAVVNRFRFSCVVAAGNVAVAVQRGTGGGSSTPSAEQAWFSGFTPAVATSDTRAPQEIVVPGGMVVYAGDFIVFSCDDPAAQFLTAGGPSSGVLGTLFEGVSYVSRAQATPPVDATGLTPAPYRGPLVVGRP